MLFFRKRRREKGVDLGGKQGVAEIMDEVSGFVEGLGWKLGRGRDSRVVKENENMTRVGETQQWYIREEQLGKRHFPKSRSCKPKYEQNSRMPTPRRLR